VSNKSGGNTQSNTDTTQSSVSHIFKKKQHGGHKKNQKSPSSTETSTSCITTTSSTSSSCSSESSTSYQTESDVYKTVTTEDGLKKAYKKVYKEMDTIANQKGGKMITKEITNRMNFLINCLNILDNIKK